MDTIKTLLLSKKFIGTLVGVIAAIAARHGFNLPVEESAAILAAFMTYVFSQGQADKGKEAALIQAANPQPEQINVQNVNTEAPPSKPEVKNFDF